MVKSRKRERKERARGNEGEEGRALVDENK